MDVGVGFGGGGTGTGGTGVGAGAFAAGGGGATFTNCTRSRTPMFGLPPEPRVPPPPPPAGPSPPAPWISSSTMGAAHGETITSSTSRWRSAETSAPRHDFPSREGTPAGGR